MAVVCSGAFGQSRAIVDYVSDYGRSVQVAPDSTATALVGGVMFHHNGAIMSCDSAVLYNQRYIECFSNVIINRDSTYVYGDRAEFDGVTNIARVYSPIVKTVDGDMTMYSLEEVEFNTLTNIGRYTRGGTFVQKDNRMESQEATYHANVREAFFSREVVMRNEEYLIQTDSLGYNMDTELATFYRPARIWNSDGDFLRADRGSYDRAGDTYTFTQNSYVLTADQEIHADSITYLRTAGRVFLFGNVQIHDETQRAYLFGDHGVYWTDDQQALMTDNASSIFYEEQAGRDSVYMRADSMLLYSLRPGMDEQDAVDRMLGLAGRGELHDSALVAVQAEFPIERDSTAAPLDSLALWTDMPFGRAGGAAADSAARALVDSLPTAPPPAEDTLITAPLETAADEVPDDEPAPPDPEVVKEVIGEAPLPEAPLTDRERRRAERLERRAGRMRDYLESTGQLAPRADSTAVDSLAVDSTLLAVDSLAVADSTLMTADTLGADSVRRIIRAYRHVKIFRNDLQAIGDSLTAYSLDSTAHLYRQPVLWNGDNQITSDVMHFYSRDEQLLRAEFEVTPLMVGRVVDSLRMADSLFNQVRGERMTAHFADNSIHRYDVLGDAHAWYYMEEQGALKGFLVATSKEMFFRFANENDSVRLDAIAAVKQVDWALYPMDKIPETVPRRMEIFQWKEALRPRTRRDVWDRRLLPSERQASAAIEQPRFPITARIDEARRSLTESGTWRDRSELIHVDPGYFSSDNEEGL